MSLQASTSRLIRRQLRQSVPGTSYCSCTPGPIGWTARSRWQSTRLQSTSTAGSVDAQDSIPEEHDIVIVGGGLVGLALANALCRSDRVHYLLISGHRAWPDIQAEPFFFACSYILYHPICRHKGISPRRQRSRQSRTMVHATREVVKSNIQYHE